MLVVVALVSSSAWAAWNPYAADPNLVFNMNFDTNDTNGPPPTTTDAKAGLVGTLENYNLSHYVLWEAGKIGKDANFGQPYDKSPGSGLDGNDCHIVVPPSPIFDLGTYNTDKHTFTFWFNVPEAGGLTSGTIMRHASIYLETTEGYEDLLWEIRIYNSKLHFYHKNNSLRMETASSLTDPNLGLTPETWHHVAIVIDRTASDWMTYPEKYCKIYIDGLEVPVIVTYHNTSSMNVDLDHTSPLWIGAGERDFDGLLDEIRLYKSALSPVQVSILYQSDKTVKPVAVLPIPRSSNVVMDTNLSWVPAVGATAQQVYFGTDPNNLVLKKSGGGAMNEVNNTELGGLLALSIYYWDVNTTYGGSPVAGPLWSFTAEAGEALNPSPANGQEDVNVGATDLKWKGTPSAINYKVYFSNNESFVEDMCDAALVPDNNIFDTNIAVTTTLMAENYYWCVESNLVPEVNKLPVDSNVWTFRTKPYPIVFNTDVCDVNYSGQIIPGYKCMRMEPDSSWTTLATGSIDSNSGDGVPVIVFDFDSFVYNQRYDIIVLPQYGAGDDGNVIPTPLAIHTVGDFYFDGRMDICGEDVTTATILPRACSGGFPGARVNAGNGNGAPNYYYQITIPVPEPNTGHYIHHRYGDFNSSLKYVWLVTTEGYGRYGPGTGVVPPDRCGGGGGYGGIGGDSGCGYYYGVFSGGPTYGDEEVPVAFGGSAGGWGLNAPGGSGGGGVEIVATGNVVLDSNSEIHADGGGMLLSAVQYPGGGGSGGSVRIIADGSVTNKGIITVNGGKGGDGYDKSNNTGGGGGGGRVAIFYSNTYTNNGSITADGGDRGTYFGTGLAENGKDGTIFVIKTSPTRRKASAPTPKNGDEMVYCPNSTSGNWLTLKWYSGYNKMSANDIVYFREGSPPNDGNQIGAPVPATRGQHSSTVDVNIVKDKTYYFKVKTVPVDGNDSNTVSSDVFSFKTVGWQCPIATPDFNDLHVGGPVWDSNRDCVLDGKDLSYFARHWRDLGFGDYVLDGADLGRFVNEWLDCIGRTNSGCDGW